MLELLEKLACWHRRNSTSPFIEEEEEEEGPFKNSSLIGCLSIVPVAMFHEALGAESSINSLGFTFK